MSDFGFVGQAYTAASPTQDNQELINAYPEIDVMKPDGSRGVIALYPCPGLTTVATLAAASVVRGLHVIPGGTILLAVCGAYLYSITTAYVATNVGTLASTTGPVSISDNGVAAYITDGTNRYAYTFAGVFTTISDGAFNGGNVTTEADNYMFYNRPNTNQIGCTDVGSTASYVLNLASKIGASDNVVSIIADHRQLLLLGETTSERWADTGSSPFPYTIVPGTSIQHGCQATFSVARLGEGVAFLSLDDRGQATVLQWGATFPAPKRISTMAVENAIQKYTTVSDAIGYTYTQAGHEFYVLTFPTQDVTWCYDLATDAWHKRSWRDPATNSYHRHRGNCATPFNDEIIVGDYSNGKLYKFDQTCYTDAGDPLPIVRRCPHLTQDLKNQFYTDLQIQFQPGVGIQTGQGSDPECLLRWSNDGGFTWGNYHSLKIGKAGKYRNRAIRRRLGYARDRVFEVLVTDPVYRVIVSANLNGSTGAN